MKKYLYFFFLLFQKIVLGDSLYSVEVRGPISTGHETHSKLEVFLSDKMRANILWEGISIKGKVLPKEKFKRYAKSIKLARKEISKSRNLSSSCHHSLKIQIKENGKGENLSLCPGTKAYETSLKFYAIIRNAYFTSP